MTIRNGSTTLRNDQTAVRNGSTTVRNDQTTVRNDQTKEFGNELTRIFTNFFFVLIRANSLQKHFWFIQVRGLEIRDWKRL